MAGRNELWLVLALVLPLVLVNFLPPDTSWKHVRAAGVLSACIPQHYPPLVQTNQATPGIDVELLQALAAELGLRLQLNPNAAIGRDANPRNWRVTRAQCQVLAGGVVDSQVTRAFLERTQPYLQSGWAILYPSSTTELRGKTVGVYVGISGLDRIALGQFLNQQKVDAVTVQSQAELQAGLEQGRFAAGIGEALSLRSMLGDFKVEWLPESLGRPSLILGLWKGDLTLKRKITAALGRLERGRKLEDILGKYRLAPIGPLCSICR